MSQIFLFNIEGGEEIRIALRDGVKKTREFGDQMCSYLSDIFEEQAVTDNTAYRALERPTSRRERACRRRG